ncbi:urate hydroxylase PuuD [Neotabrizicola sp. VNH66]|uniref:urate hydroxylase PuuD n=1 Tax=Neotabrizicola sp. VNH66 TaxID=3400918 RepID=UPI003C004FAC
MYEWVVLGEWVEIAARWLHVITAIAWIGSSFYFVALDLGLRKTPSLPPLAHGEEWQVHGGGFYHIQKYLVAPEFLPEHLVWFKWESYMTWLSGFSMLVLVYYLSADLFLIDPNVMALTQAQAIGISLASLAFGWVVYNQICKVFVAANQTLVMIALFVVLVGMSYFYTSVFSGRAAMLHLGAFTATIMSANVFFIIMPNQRVVVADLKAGRVPDPKYGKIAKQRSTHNNYLTLPVLFLMLSNHYPLVFATKYNWIIACLVFLMGVSIRHWFNTRHAGKGNPHWTWLVTVLLFLAIARLSVERVETMPEDAALTKVSMPFAAAPGFDEVVSIVQGRCSMCHAAEPSWEGLHWAPKAVVLETPAQIAQEARRIYLQAGLSHAMPPGNLSYMEETERQKIVDWFRAAGKADPI